MKRSWEGDDEKMLRGMDEKEIGKGVRSKEKKEESRVRRKRKS